MTEFVQEDVLQNRFIRWTAERPFKHDDVLIGFIGEESPGESSAQWGAGPVDQVEICCCLIIGGCDGDSEAEVVPFVSGLLEGRSGKLSSIARGESAPLNKVKEFSIGLPVHIPSWNDGTYSDDKAIVVLRVGGEVGCRGGTKGGSAAILSLEHQFFGGLGHVCGEWICSTFCQGFSGTLVGRAAPMLGFLVQFVQNESNKKYET